LKLTVTRTGVSPELMVFADPSELGSDIPTWPDSKFVAHRARGGQPEGGNIGYGDGHVEWRAFTAMKMRYTYMTGKRDYYW
jgi:prepilin-type processing-associated H-X9-DG protein